MQLAIDAADDEPGIALAVDGVAALTATWVTQRNHSVELLPNIDRLLDEAGRTKADIEAVFVDLGPGGYAALRVGVSIAKALAHGLGVPIVGDRAAGAGRIRRRGRRGRAPHRRGAPRRARRGGVGGVPSTATAAGARSSAPRIGEGGGPASTRSSAATS